MLSNNSIMPQKCRQKINQIKGKQEVICMNKEDEIQYYDTLFKDYPDIIRVDTLKEILPKIGKNKLYKLLQDKKIYSKRIGRDYYIPKVSVIKYLMEK